VAELFAAQRLDPGRVYLTGASGFVGSNIVRVFGERGAELIRPEHGEVDITDAAAVRRSVEAAAPGAIVHAAIWNDPAALLSDRPRAWASYVGATRHLVDAANAAGAHIVLVSTDWVFDGRQGPAAEDEPPNPINAYGFLKAASELVVTERAERGTVARIAGVQGVHWSRPALPRSQDAGFGYLVASLVEALRDGRRFKVWDDPRINVRATPTLATDAAAMIWRALERGATGILHCTGGEHADRVGLARRAVAAFGLDEDLLDVGPADPAALGDGAVPYDTRLEATATAARLGVELPDLDTMLGRLRAQLETCWSAA
jgi:dTDP-4-dehydrorhamnose reductase